MIINKRSVIGLFIAVISVAALFVCEPVYETYAVFGTTAIAGLVIFLIG